MRSARAERWFWPALTLVIAVTGLRWLALAHDRTDLFVDETQYWLWSRTPAWGYYSKPPLIAWVIGAVTSVFGDSSFVIRLPGAALHGVTALILGVVAARRFGTGAFTAVAVYLLAPFVAVGGLMISTDTVMLPSLALALWCHALLIKTRHLRWALACGLALGLASLGKYAGLYGLGAFLISNHFPEARIGLRASVLMGLACLLVLSPNLVWNLQNDFATLQATGDNIGWIKEARPLGGWLSALGFLATQVVVFGPLTFAALVWAMPRAPRDLVVFVALPLVLVTGQAWAAKAYANWALTAYVPGTLLAASVLASHKLWRGLALGLNLTVALALPALTLFPEVALQGRPVLARYLGRGDLSQDILALARAGGSIPVVTPNRDILADLFYTDRHWHSVAIHAPPSPAPNNFYEQMHALQPGFAAEVLYVGALPPGCSPIGEMQLLDGHGAWAGHLIQVSRINPACLFP